MPNYITNKLKIFGEKSLVERIKQEISSVEEDNKVYPINFNQVWPIPNELKGTASPVRTLTQEEYDAQEARIASGDLEEHEKKFGISRGLTKELQEEYKRRFGACDWYEWQTINWGTKWNAIGALDEGKHIHFLTAWSTPFVLIGRLSKKYPEAEFNVRYADEDFGYNVGEYTFNNGDLVYNNVPDGGTPEAYLMAGDITDPSYISCRIEEMDEGELKEKWAINFIKAAYRGGIFGDYQEFVWDMLKQISIEEENYEMAQKIRDHLEMNRV
jgi:hypothetical protein